MSALQCINTVKKRSRVQSSRGAESSLSDIRLKETRKQPRQENVLYDIEVIEEDGGQVKVHYKGYGSEYDEWKPKTEIVLRGPEFFGNVAEESFSPLTELARCIKKRLLPTKSDDPEVRIQIPCDNGSFRELQQKAMLLGRCARGGSDQYTITNYCDLNDILGERWHLRVVNLIGDFSYVILKTISFYISKSRPIQEYEILERENGTFDFAPSYIEQLSFILFCAW